MRTFRDAYRFMPVLLMPVLLLLARSGILAAATPPTPEPIVQDEAAMPAGSTGALYPYRLLPAPDGTAAAAAELTIDVWFGDDQSFGAPGLPQRWANILGNVSGPRPITSLSYTLNGGPAQPLSMGADRKRLWGMGDFNIELDAAALVAYPGKNTVVITANDGVSTVKRTVMVTYEAGRNWPLPYTANWGQLASVTDGGQVVDGNWAIIDGRLRNLAPGFDRLIAIGSMNWSTYEVKVPVTVYSVNTDGWSGPSNGAGIGLIARWSGHYLIENEQPRLGWRDLGALAWYHWYTDGTGGYEILGDTGRLLAMSAKAAPKLNETYIIKLRVETPTEAGAAATYRFKIWPAAEQEPAAWLLQTSGVVGEPNSGSVVLVAHQVMASFGTVEIRPLDEPPAEPLRVSVSGGVGGTVGSVAYGSADIISHNGQSWAMAMRSAAAGISKNVVGYEQAASGEMLYALIAPQTVGQGAAAVAVTPYDVLGVNPTTGARRIVLRGGDVGLTSAAERIDALAFAPDGRLVISTRGVARVPCLGAAAGCSAGTLVAQDEDLIVFTPSAGHTGPVSRGTWEMWFDGSTVTGLARHNVNGASINAANGTIYLTVNGNYRLGSISGTSRDIFAVSRTGSTYTVRNAWAGRPAGFPGLLDAIDVKPLP